MPREHHNPTRRARPLGSPALLGRLRRSTQSAARGSGLALLGDGAAMRGEFLARFAQARRELDARLDASGIRHAEYVLDQPLDLPLRRLFGSRDAAEYA